MFSAFIRIGPVFLCVFLLLCVVYFHSVDLCSVVSTGANDKLERLVSEVTDNVGEGGAR